MNIRRAVLLALIAACPASAHAQANPNTANARMLWGSVRDYIVAAAADVPESMYSYKPTPEVRSFGQVIAHVAGAQHMFCALALGEKAGDEDAIEKSATTKAALVKALRESNDYCARAYAGSDAVNASMIDLFGQQRSKQFTLLMNAAHDNEHYGNIVTYMRLNKMTPPSSKR